MKIKSWFLLIIIIANFILCHANFEKAAFWTMCSFKCQEDKDRQQCMQNCTQIKKNIEYNEEEASANATLVCRDVKFIVLRHNPGMFVIDSRSSLNDNWSNAVRSIGNNATLHHLLPETRYQFRLHRVFEDTVSKPEITEWFDTMSDTHEPSKVTNISVLSLEIDANDPMHMRAVISFTPAKDRSCFYDVLCSDSKNGNKLAELNKPMEFNVTFIGLEFGTNYTIRIKARTRRAIEGDKSIMIFPTPTCLDTHRSLMMCVPALVTGLNATTTRKGDDNFDVNVTWDMPELIPEFYDVWMYPIIADNQFPILQRVNGTNNETVFSDVKIVEQFEVNIRARSPRGSGPTITKRFKIFQQKPKITTESPSIPDVGTIIMTFLASVVLVVGTGVYAYHRHGKRIRNQMRLEYFRDLEENHAALETIKDIEDPDPITVDKSLLAPVDEYEVFPDRLEIKRVLGSGAFGVVKLGSLRDDRGQVTKVAVKMLRDDPNEEDLRSFELEIKMMKSVGQHPNIVCLIGCCTIGPRPLLIVEYCSRGDLQSFLRAILEKATVSMTETKKRCESNSRSSDRDETLKDSSDESFSTSESSNDDAHISSFVANRAYDIDRDAFRDTEMLTVTDLLNFGRQIATGMEFLSSNRVVHRDLAARNVLVCDDKTVKISDFGLSRDIYQENVYKKKQGGGRVPVKWMAIEALTHQVYSTFSDVWSFGILLWEIVTLGSSPYPDIPANGVLKRLRLGYRMERPPNCSIPLYNVMLSCWQTKPKDRPTFTTLRKELDRLLCVAADTEYLDLNDVSRESLPEDEDMKISSSRYTYLSLQPRYVNDNDLRVIREDLQE